MKKGYRSRGGSDSPMKGIRTGMFEKNPPCNGGGEGRGDCNPRELYGLEGKALAMVYSPKQYWRMTYSPEDALRHGTLFEELDKPFAAGMGKER